MDCTTQYTKENVSEIGYKVIEIISLTRRDNRFRKYKFHQLNHNEEKEGEADNLFQEIMVNPPFQIKQIHNLKT